MNNGCGTATTTTTEKKVKRKKKCTGNICGCDYDIINCRIEISDYFHFFFFNIPTNNNIKKKSFLLLNLFKIVVVCLSFFVLFVS